MRLIRVKRNPSSAPSGIKNAAELTADLADKKYVGQPRPIDLSEMMQADAAAQAMFGFREITNKNRLYSFLNKELPAEDLF
jgi:hypothetical protein